jgi:uncharacterized lipoprotein YmbA
MSKKLKPKPGESYKDHDGRTLVVSEVKVPDRLGREVIGKLKLKGERKRYNYATTLEGWRETWRDKCQPIPIGRMKIG